MMNNKQQAAELAAQAYQLDKLMREEQGLMPLIQSGFRGGLKPLMILAYLLALLLTVAICPSLCSTNCQGALAARSNKGKELCALS